MAMQFPIYARPSDEVGRLAAISLATGVEDPDNPLENLATFNPAAIFLTSSSGTDVDIVWDHLIATVIKLFSLHHHNLPAGTVIRVQRNATNVWVAPTIDVAIVIGVYPQAGLPLPIGVDLTAEDGYDDEAGLRYTRLHIPSLPQFVGLGSALLWAEKRTDLDPVHTPNVFDEDQPATQFSTSYGVELGYRKGFRLRSKPYHKGEFDDGWAAFQALYRECSTVDPFLWWADPTHDRDAWLAKFGSSRLRESRPAEIAHEFDGVINEVACGGAIPTEVAT